MTISAAREVPLPVAANDNEPDYWPLGRAYSRGLLGDEDEAREVMKGVLAYRRAMEDGGDESATAPGWMPTHNGSPIICRDPEALWAAERYADRAGRLRRFWRLLGTLARPWHAAVAERAELSSFAPTDATQRLAPRGGALRIRTAGIIVARAADNDNFGRYDAMAEIRRAADEWRAIRHPRLAEQEPPAIRGTIAA